MRRFRYCFFPLLALLLFSQANSTGTDLYMPRDIRRAYDRGTRSLTGAPGTAYWQNKADYRIRVSIDPVSRLLRGEETVVYRNNSPDTLRQLVLKLHQNMNRAGAARWSPLGERAVTDGMRISRLAAGGAERKLFPGSEEAQVEQGNLIVTLPLPLAPKASVELTAAWEFTIPVTTGEGGGNPRMGTYENGSMFIAYWYPKLAVYDDVHGWDMHSYDGEHEFYSDYGDFEVELTIPERYGVWATGILSNAGDVLREPYLARYRSAQKSDTVVRIVNEAEASGMSPYLSTSGKTVWKFRAEDVPDFAFGLARGYCWDGVSAKAGDTRVFVDAAYDPASKSFLEVAAEARETVEMLSAARPGVPFPYPAITVFNGYYGMEFPMIVNDGEFPNRILNVYVHAHEIAHNYFPFMVGVNETRYAWMDEGLAYFLPVDVQKKQSNYDHMIRAARGYERFAGTEEDYPLLVPAIASGGDNLQVLAYIKPATALNILRDAMGAEAFDAALRGFITRWKGRHPIPWDFFYSFNDVSGIDWNWFWRPWFFEPGYPDLAISKVNARDGMTEVTVTRKGSMPVPVHIEVTLDGGATQSVSETAAVWKTGATEATFRIEHTAAVNSLRLGDTWIPDSDPSNNTWKKEG
ncbi:MAG: M1 family metallopeptidase [Bacteroidetes bacterium]|nr:M1 family metallopeptidase [Bacteroidota bacterium]